MINRIVLSLSALLLFSCVSNKDFTEVMVNKTVKVFLEDYHKKAENYTFRWSPPEGPDGAEDNYTIKNDILLFTPTIAGDYEIKLSVVDISEEIVTDEVFFYRAIPETLEVAIAKTVELPENTDQPIKTPEKQPSKKEVSRPVIQPKAKKTQKEKSIQKDYGNYNYTIQVAAWTSLEEARKEQLILIDEGFDAYTQKHYKKDKDEVWYRVRVGKFADRKKAQEVQKQIESIHGGKTWLDILKL